MTRKEQIRDAAMYFAKKNEKVPFPYLDFIEAAEWADRTMIERACEWLMQQEEMVGISFEDDFIERFRKAMEE